MRRLFITGLWLMVGTIVTLLALLHLRRVDPPGAVTTTSRGPLPHPPRPFGYLDAYALPEGHRCLKTATYPAFEVCTWPSAEDVYVSRGLEVGGIWEGNLMDAVKLVLDEWVSLGHDAGKSAVIDVGANLGLYGMYAATLGFRVYMFEPLPHNLALIREGVRANGFSESAVRIFPVAASDREGVLPIHVPSDNKGGSSLVAGHAAPIACNVSARRIDDLIDAIADGDISGEAPEGFPVMKIDVEAWEGCAVLGAQRLLSSRKVRYIFLEIWKRHSPCIDSMELLRMMTGWGYSLYAGVHRYLETGGAESLTPSELHDRLLYRKERADIFLALGDGSTDASRV